MHLLRFHRAQHSCWGKPDSMSFFFSRPLKKEGKKYKHKQKGAQCVMRLNKWTSGKKRCEKRQMGAVLVTGEDVGKTVVTVGIGQI